MYDHLTKLPRYAKSFVMFLTDSLLVFICLFLALWLRVGTLPTFEVFSGAISTVSQFILVSLIAIFVSGLHRVKLSGYERSAVFRTAWLSFFMASALAFFNFLYGNPLPRSTALIFGPLFLVASMGARLIGQIVLDLLNDLENKRARVAIYGAGDKGTLLAYALRQSKEYRPYFFIEENTALGNVEIAGLPVYSDSGVVNMLRRKKIDSIILAIPSTQRERIKQLTQRFVGLNYKVQILPSYADLLLGDDVSARLKDVEPGDLLGRETVDLNLPIVREVYAKKTVMVTGAGGSIGSELCRQLLTCGIKKLVLFEHSEFGLYQLDQELRSEARIMGIEIASVLGNVCNQASVEETLESENVQVVLHAAAYKHVPIVEENETAGLMNNVIGTRVVSASCRKLNIERFILVSTDKAVRPTNIMGASKRMAELVVQDLASRSNVTIFSMVRFGNVLGSSGSVIPLFRDQIAAGGPVTVTHKEITRYFMTIPEAARLVLLCGCFSKGGDVFVLDMGKPRKIYDLAVRMIELCGLKQKTEENPKGDIEIEVVGLRPGEKLYEELLIGEGAITTQHAKIMRAQEVHLSELEVAKMLSEIIAAFEDKDAESARASVARWVEGYQPPSVNAM